MSPMVLDELQVTPITDPALEAARYRRAECTEAIASVERAAHAPWKGLESRWLRGVSDALRRLRDAFALHISLSEQPEGLLEEVVEDEPRMSHKAAQLRAEHAALREAIELTLSELEGSGPPLDVEAVRRSVLELVRAASQHRRASSSFVYEAYGSDLGTGD